MWFEYFDFDTHMVLMPFQVIRSPGFTYNFFQVILITLGLTFQNLAVDKTNNCTNPLIKTPGPIMSDDVMASYKFKGQLMSLKVILKSEIQIGISFPVRRCVFDRNMTPIDLHLYL